MFLGTNHDPGPDNKCDERGWPVGPSFEERGSWAEERTLVHLVLLDGRLVDSWREPVEGTRWEHLLQERVRPVVQLPRDESRDLLDWLAALCGSRPALDTLTDEPLVAGTSSPEQGTDDDATVPDELDGLLVKLGDSCFDSETVVAMRRAAVLLASRSGSNGPDLTARQRASGIAWAVAKANGLLGPGLTSAGAIQHTLELTSAIATSGRAVERALSGPLLFQPPRPRGVPDLLALGRTDLLLGATRRALITWRDRALAAQAAATAQHPCSRCSPE